MRKKESGQALVLVLLSLSVVLTIVLYILSRSVTDIAVSSRQEESIRAFSAAEAGIERALVIGTDFSSTIGTGGARYNTHVTGFAVGTQDFAFPLPLSSGDTATTWFIGHDGNGNMTPTGAFTGSQMKVCWGNPDAEANSQVSPAVEISVYYESTPGDLGSIKVARSVFDPNSGRTPSNSFTLADLSSCTISGNTYAFQKTISFAGLGIPLASYSNAGGLQFARVKMLYNTDLPHTVGTSVNFVGNSVLPSQGTEITSTGIAGGSNRKISVFQSWAESPFASNSLFVPDGITK